MLMAGAGHDMKVMFPMIADVSEFVMAKAAVMKEKAYLAARGHALAEVAGNRRDDRNPVTDLAA